jgi:hypothetical protein
MNLSSWCGHRGDPCDDLEPLSREDHPAMGETIAGIVLAVAAFGT